MPTPRPVHNLLRTLTSRSVVPVTGRLLLALLARIRAGHPTLATPDGGHQLFGDPHARPAAALRMLDWCACRAILRAWQQAFVARRDAVRTQGFDEVFIRTWRRYLMYCEAAFAERKTDVMHYVVGRQG
ncbi:Cyclopropane-fatty-acyl-phospholipid synthase [Burkholderia glumae BGR1]|uniref:Class I SAM-dependent methyltransferase n=1 Tax=Burkholderia glumae TaxID=337 RepID=A0AAP9XWS6_BURGL|nr:class I SAM-dependent methyltransferase [Burkholderia glumae]ACR32217.1 Cyclopropane-fatty-acyl-phospholipid synthase [Burkholderia glumae BGR1]AJY64503.1 mycolic acid cyclopropane synthetase family protein [Burkholderia glumae LMG 2196 = ATCC 33617]KHJ60549.1 cyclopropane-fatty-acyl-phospholipid synthase [Burkholderia glumae]MCM2484595.1 class I SAM-dependent methyltransferase [Burkholderia glumae]MCM2510288.1 class I SAM-dependent methyltransferase [Burkholderia glumae]